MRFTIIDKNVSKEMNIFLVIANIINLIYNIPQIVKTCKSKSTKDFSGWFLSLRVLGNLIWVAYAIEVDSLLMLINNIVTVVASAIIGSFMLNDMYKAWYNKKHGISAFQELDEMENHNNIIDIDNIDNIYDDKNILNKV
jgi:uncharacterized protein with PQ loop repeat